MKKIIIFSLFSILFIGFDACKKDEATPPKVIPPISENPTTDTILPKVNSSNFLKEVDTIISKSTETNVVLEEGYLTTITGLNEKIYKTNSQIHFFVKKTVIEKDSIKFPQGLDLSYSNLFQVKLSLPFAKKEETVESYLQRVMQKGTYSIKSNANPQSTEAWDLGVYYRGGYSFKNEKDYAQSKFGSQPSSNRFVIENVSFEDNTKSQRVYIIKGYIEDINLYLSNYDTHGLYKKIKKITFNIESEPINLKGVNINKPIPKETFFQKCQDSVIYKWSGNIDGKSFCFGSKSSLIWILNKYPEVLKQKRVIPKYTQLQFAFLNGNSIASSSGTVLSGVTPVYSDRRHYAGLELRFGISEDIEFGKWLDSLAQLKKIKISSEGEDLNKGVGVYLGLHEYSYSSKGGFALPYLGVYAGSALGIQNQDAYLEFTNVSKTETTSYTYYTIKGKISCTLYNNLKIIDDTSPIFGTTKDSEFEIRLGYSKD